MWCLLRARTHTHDSMWAAITLLATQVAFAVGSTATGGVNYTSDRAGNGDLVHCAATPPVSGGNEYTVVANCSGGEYIVALGFASFGTPEGGCGGFTTGACHDNHTHGRVAAVCMHEMNCSLAVTPSFGTLAACPATPWLALQWSCGPYSPTTPLPTRRPAGKDAFIIPLVATLASVLAVVLAWLLWRRMGTPHCCRGFEGRCCADTDWQQVRLIDVVDRDSGNPWADGVPLASVLHAEPR